MADKWMDERDRQMRERDWRRSERYGRGPERADDYRGREDRSFGGDERVFGERETGADYGRGPGVNPGGGAYGAGGAYGGGQSYGRGAGGGRPGYGGGRPAWQDRDFGGASPGFSSEEDARGYGDDYERQGSRAYGRPYGRPQYGASGGTGGYDYERGYGDAGRRDVRTERTERTERFEDAGRSAGEFLHRAGERVASWFSGEERDGYGPDRGHRGRGPKGYKRSDERIDEEAHERLTDDHWLDATHVSLTVSSGEVTLSGTVDSREAKHRAERIVEDIAGVNHVQNNLRIARGDGLTGSSSGFGDSVLDAQIDPSANGSGGAGSGQSMAGRKG